MFGGAQNKALVLRQRGTRDQRYESPEIWSRTDRPGFASRRLFDGVAASRHARTSQYSECAER